MTYVLHFVYGAIATAGFAVLFHIPKRNIFWASTVGGVGWLVYVYFRNQWSGALLGCFVASCLIGGLADVLSRIRKETSTAFIIPGIIPLVPGAGMYYTTLYLIQSRWEEAASKGTETMLMAGSISVGLMTMGAIFRMYGVMKAKIKNR